MDAETKRVRQGNWVKERMLNPIGKFFAPWGVLDSHRAKFWSATQSQGFMPCVPSGLRNAADSAKTVHPIALACPCPWVDVRSNWCQRRPVDQPLLPCRTLPTDVMTRSAERRLDRPSST